MTETLFPEARRGGTQDTFTLAAILWVQRARNNQRMPGRTSQSDV